MIWRMFSLFPKSVLEFDKGMPDNIRENREYVRLIYRNNE